MSGGNLWDAEDHSYIVSGRKRLFLELRCEARLRNCRGSAPFYGLRRLLRAEIPKSITSDDTPPAKSIPIGPGSRPQAAERTVSDRARASASTCRPMMCRL